MFLAPDGDEIEIANAAARLLSAVLPIDRLHRPGSADLSASVRRQLGEAGWLGLAMPEREGGGLSAVEHVLFFRELGRQCGPVDVLAQVLAAPVSAGPSIRTELVSGEAGVALIVGDAGAMRLLGAADAIYALDAGPEEARLVRLVGRGASRPALDPANSICLLDESHPREMARATGTAIFRMGMLGTAAMLVGIAEAALDMIVAYAKIRETFGRKIGSYQAVRHPCADMALRVEAARCQLWYAAAALKQRRGDADLHLDAAKHLANQAALGNADTNIQLHGGIGVTDEHNAHLLLKHALLLVKLFGSKRVVLARLLHASAEL